MYTLALHYGTRRTEHSEARVSQPKCLCVSSGGDPSVLSSPMLALHSRLRRHLEPAVPTDARPANKRQPAYPDASNEPVTKRKPRKMGLVSLVPEEGR